MMRYTSAFIGLGMMLSSGLASARTIYVETREPPPEVIVEHPAPRHGYVWVGGHHAWRGNRYNWHHGHYVRERRGYSWHDGAWDHRGDRYVWHEGGWHR